jgi:uncharacterized membrane protein
LVSFRKLAAIRRVAPRSFCCASPRNVAQTEVEIGKRHEIWYQAELAPTPDARHLAAAVAETLLLENYRFGSGSGLAMLSPSKTHNEIRDLSAAELGAIAHLYRGEIYRSTIWRTRLDNTTNWSIVTLGIALSTTFSSREASALPLILIGMLFAVFLGLEARRYRFFNVWRARARYMETHFYAPILSGRRDADDPAWRVVLADDYLHPRHHISFLRAAGRRVRRTYIWIIVIQTSAYFGKLAIHPQMATHLSEFVERAAIGPIPGSAVLGCGFIYNLGWVVLAVVTFWLDRRAHGRRTSTTAMG